jgi:TRAP-type C4-dicarboxylate transport system permease large subunit
MAAMPFIVLELMVLALIFLVPELATWLPEIMRGR